MTTQTTPETPVTETPNEVASPTPTEGASNESYTPYTPAPVSPGVGNGSNPTPPDNSEGGTNPTPPPTEGGGTTPPGGGETTPPPAETFTGWVRNKAGDIVWSQGGFKTLDEAAIAAIRWLNANGPIDEVWSSGAY